jgi:prepilin-type N-terminal cleavage/methylation domain-containing protein
MRRKSARGRQREAGFSLLEMLTVLVILTLVMGVVFAQIATVQKRYKTEETKLDMTQESREFLDQIVRDLHNAGYPSYHMYSPTALTSPIANDSRNAVGLVKFGYNDLWFEGDVDGDGQVDVVRYTLQDNGSGSCPCMIRRSQSLKLNSTDPMSQTSTNYSVQLDNLVNSLGAGRGGAALPIAGSSRIRGAGGGYTTVANDTLYAGYKSAYVFRAFDKDGVEILPTDYNTPSNKLSQIRTIKVTLNVLAKPSGVDIQTLRRPAVMLTATARLDN